MNNSKEKSHSSPAAAPASVWPPQRFVTKRLRLHHRTPRGRVGRVGEGDRRNCHGVQGDVSNLAISIASSLKSSAKRASSTSCSPMPAAPSSPLGKVSEDHFDALFNGNVKGSFHGTKALPLLPDGASIILNASTAASKAIAPEWSVYSATKAAVRSSRARGRPT